MPDGLVDALPETQPQPVRAPAKVEIVTSHRHLSADSDALQILLQASAAAESLQQRFSELQQRRAELVAEQQQLEAERRAFESRAQEFASQVARDRTQHREMMAELEQKLAVTRQQDEANDRLTTELRAAQRSLNEERVVLKQSLKAQLDDERTQIEDVRRQLEAERLQLVTRYEQDRGEHARRMLELDALLAAEKSRLTDKVREEQASELAQINREKSELQQFRDQQRAELQQQTEELQQQRELFGEQMEAEQSRLREEIEKRRQMLVTEQSNLQRRYRFQFEHLGRAREDLEQEIRDLRREQQLFRTERQHFSEQHRLRMEHLQRFRSSLEDIDASLQREARVIERTRTAAVADVERMQRRAEEERDAVVRDIDNRQRRVRQQEASLAEFAAKLDERGQRLGRLRAELDRTQGEILEQRLASEEAREILLRETAQSDIARARLEQTRSDVQSYFDRLRQQINTERDKIESASAEISDRQAQFRRDRAELEQWFSSRESELTQRSTDSVVNELHTRIELQTRQFEEQQERWRADRREAEHSIRELLDRLANIESAALHAAATSKFMPPTRDAA